MINRPLMAAAVRALTDANTTATVSERRTQGCTVWLQKQIAVTLTNVVIFCSLHSHRAKFLHKGSRKNSQPGVNDLHWLLKRCEACWIVSVQIFNSQRFEHGPAS